MKLPLLIPREVLPVTVTTASDIWDAAWQRCLKLPGFRTYRQGPILQMTQPEELPILCCYMVGCDGSPNGDSNAGPVRLRESVQIGFSGIVIDSDAGVQHAEMVAAARALDDLLFTDLTFVDFDLINGIEQRRVKYMTGQVAQAPTTEFHYLLTVSVNNIWEALPRDKFLSLHESTAFPNQKPDDAAGHTPQVKSVWDIPQE